MKAIKYFSKPIIIFVHLAILTLLTIAIIIPFCKDLFVADKIVKSSYEIFITKPLTFTFQGIISFSNELINNQGTNYVSSIMTYSDDLVSSLKGIKTTIICIFVLVALLLVSQISKYRIYATNICSIILLALMLILKNQGLSNFADSKLIIESTAAFTNVIVLLIIAICLSFVQIAFKEFIERK